MGSYSVVECEGGAAASFVGTWMASATGVMAPSESFFEPLVAGNQKASLTSFSIALPIQALRGLPCLGPFSVVHHVRHIEGPPWLGSYSVVQGIRHLKEHPG